MRLPHNLRELVDLLYYTEEIRKLEKFWLNYSDLKGNCWKTNEKFGPNCVFLSSRELFEQPSWSYKCLYYVDLWMVMRECCRPDSISEASGFYICVKRKNYVKKGRIFKICFLNNFIVHVENSLLFSIVCLKSYAVHYLSGPCTYWSLQASLALHQMYFLWCTLSKRSQDQHLSSVC